MNAERDKARKGGGMRGILCCLPLLVLVAGCRRDLKTPEEVVQKMVTTYGALKSYEDHSTETRIQKRNEETQQASVEHRFAYQAPNQFLFDIQFKGQRVRAVASDGKMIRSLIGNGVLEAEAPA